MIFEKISLVLQGLLNGFTLFNVFLPAVDNRNVSYLNERKVCQCEKGGNAGKETEKGTQAQGNNSSCQNVKNMSSFVHDVNLGENTNGSASLFPQKIKRDGQKKISPIKGQRR